MPFSYSLSRYRVESVRWQEDGRVALVDNVYSAVHGLMETIYSAMDGPGEPLYSMSRIARLSHTQKKGESGYQDYMRTQHNTCYIHSYLLIL